VEVKRWRWLGERAPSVILVVEDNPYEREILAAALAEAGSSFVLWQVADSNQAAQVLFDEPEDEERAFVRAVLLDLHLSGSDSLELLRKIRSNPQTQFLPVVMFSSSCEPREIANCYRNGANSYVIKPMQFDRFCEVARMVIQYWIEINEPANHRL
jgi:two-component system response regulator